MNNLNDIMQTKEMNDACGLIGNMLYEAITPIEDKAGVNISELAEQAFEDNLTSIIAALVKLEKYHDKEDIIRVLQFYSEQMCAIGMLFAKASYLDY